MAYDKNWPRWIQASLCSAFDAWNQALEAPYVLFVEGQERKTQVPAWVEFRVNGPRSRETTKGFYRLTVEVNVICACDVDSDLYHINRITGDVAEFMTNTIAVFKLGNGASDDPAIQIGCLQKTTLGGEDVIIRQKGQAEPKTKKMQATVAAKYFIDIP